MHVAPCTLPLCPLTGVISKISPPGALETWPGERVRAWEQIQVLPVGGDGSPSSRVWGWGPGRDFFSHFFFPVRGELEKQGKKQRKMNQEVSSRLGFGLETALLKNNKSFCTINSYKRKNKKGWEPLIQPARQTHPWPQIHFQKAPLPMLVVGRSWQGSHGPSNNPCMGEGVLHST